MQENKEMELELEKEQLTKNIDRLKVVKIASIILFVCDILSLLFSLITKQELIIQPREIGYIIVLVVCIIIFVVSTILIGKTKKKISKLEDK